MPVTRAFSDEAETYRAPGAMGRGAVEAQPLEAAAPTVPIPAAHGSADGTVVDREVSRHGNEDPGGGQHERSTERQRLLFVFMIGVHRVRAQRHRRRAATV